VELNVIEQCINLFKTGAHLLPFLLALCFIVQALRCFTVTGVIQRKRIQTRSELLASGKKADELGDEVYPRIHGMVFNPADGVLKRLPVNFSRRVGSLDHIYGLYAA
jgi:hypothetical protein